MKTKDFNLEEALNGATVVYGEYLCKLYHIPECKTYPYLVVFKDGGKVGEYDESELIDKFKLLDETPLVEWWVNVYWDGNDIGIGSGYKTKEEALSKAEKTNYLKTIRLTNEKRGTNE